MSQNDSPFESSSLKSALQIYSLYRLLQITTLLFLFFFGSSTGYLGKQSPFLFLLSASIYFGLCLISVLQSFLKKLPDIRGNGILFVFLIDVLAISSFIHFSGGIHGSLGIMMVVVVATAGIFLKGRMALFIAALSSLAILFEQIYLYINFDKAGDNFAATGILGFALFGAALIVQQLAERLRTSEELLYEQSEQVQALEQLNEKIIERMPSGVIVVDNKLRLKFMNTAAWRLLNTPKFPDATPLKDISPNLGRQLEAWRENPNISPETFSVGNSGVLLSANFVHLENPDNQIDEKRNSEIIIFIEDATLVSQRAQKLKLASLGTLTAGIAHEIRNPLGAISHAAQLLNESEALVEPDQRLTEIIQQHSIRMNRIIENVLQLSRQKTGKIEPIDLKEWLKHFLREFKASKPFDIKLILEFGENVGNIEVDSSQLSQVLTNLCENGLRYSLKETGENYIRIYCGFNEVRHHHYIDIIDKGPGISPDEAEHIFEPFYTTDSRGSGLGLYIAKELCENNRSELSFIPIPEGGSCFRINFSG